MLRSGLFAGLLLVGTSAGALTLTANEVDFSTADIGQSFSFEMYGVAGDLHRLPGLEAEAEFTIQSMTSSQVVLSLALSNTSSLPVTASRVSVLAFDTSPSLLSAGENSSLFNRVVLNGEMPVAGSVRFCATTGPNCTHGTGGVAQGQTGAATLTLNFANGALANGVTLSNLHVRFQGIVGYPNRTTAVGNTGTSPIPEPTAAGSFALGALLAGWALRKRMHA